MASHEEIARNRSAIANAIASQRLEGLEPDARAMADLDRAACGELSIEAVLANYAERVANGDV